jgi:hypothetical protein
MRSTRLAVLVLFGEAEICYVEDGRLPARSGGRTGGSGSTARPAGSPGGPRFADGRPLRNVVDTRLGYVGLAPLVGTLREGSIG